MFCNLTFWSYKLEICFTISLKISLLPFCGRLKDNGFSCHLSSWPFEVEMCFKISLCWRRCSMLRKTMDVFVTYMFCFLFLDISLLVWCGVQNQRGLFCFDFVFQDIFLLAVVFKTRKGVLLLCFNISLCRCGVVFKTREGFLLSLPATWDEPLFLPANGPIVQGDFRKYWNIKDYFDEIFKAHWKG